MCPLEAKGLDVMGDVSDALVEFLRSRAQRAYVVSAGKKLINLSHMLLQEICTCIRQLLTKDN